MANHISKSLPGNSLPGKSEAVSLSVPEHVLERLIASGALCAADVDCESPGDKRRIMAICKRCCARPFASNH